MEAREEEEREEPRGYEMYEYGGREVGEEAGETVGVEEGMVLTERGEEFFGTYEGTEEVTSREATRVKEPGEAEWIPRRFSLPRTYLVVAAAVVGLLVALTLYYAR
ncbi:hypothetical protein [Methanopyrus sp.]